jgi:hypothetical protein
MGKMINEYRFLFGKPEWKRAHGRRSYRWEDNIKMENKLGGFRLGSSGSR